MQMGDEEPPVEFNLGFSGSDRSIHLSGINFSASGPHK
jgi:hypothetical protein